MSLTRYQAKLMWFQTFTGWEPVLDEPGEATVYKADEVARGLKEYMEVLRALVDVQNGPPLYKYEQDWKAVMERAHRLLKELEP